ncbi:hypothetical protein B5S28_g2209 [[Candida] boidinii]|nr:hypothetical protein B5S28_g2209 [[Candida] boidinii]
MSPISTNIENDDKNKSTTKLNNTITTSTTKTTGKSPTPSMTSVPNSPNTSVSFANTTASSTGTGASNTSSKNIQNQNNASKRSVAKRACLACREKKIKCDGEILRTLYEVTGENSANKDMTIFMCTNCKLTGTGCVFVPSKRGGRRRKYPQQQQQQQHQSQKQNTSTPKPGSSGNSLSLSPTHLQNQSPQSQVSSLSQPPQSDLRKLIHSNRNLKVSESEVSISNLPYPVSTVSSNSSNSSNNSNNSSTLPSLHLKNQEKSITDINDTSNTNEKSLKRLSSSKNKNKDLLEYQDRIQQHYPNPYSHHPPFPPPPHHHRHHHHPPPHPRHFREGPYGGHPPPPPPYFPHEFGPPPHHLHGPPPPFPHGPPPPPHFGRHSLPPPPHLRSPNNSPTGSEQLPPFSPFPPLQQHESSSKDKLHPSYATSGSQGPSPPPPPPPSSAPHYPHHPPPPHSFPFPPYRSSSSSFQSPVPPSRSFLPFAGNSAQSDKTLNGDDASLSGRHRLGSYAESSSLKKEGSAGVRYPDSYAGDERDSVVGYSVYGEKLYDLEATNDYSRSSEITRSIAPSDSISLAQFKQAPNHHKLDAKKLNEGEVAGEGLLKRKFSITDINNSEHDIISGENKGLVDKDRMEIDLEATDDDKTKNWIEQQKEYRLNEHKANQIKVSESSSNYKRQLISGIKNDDNSLERNEDIKYKIPPTHINNEELLHLGLPEWKTTNIFIDLYYKYVNPSYQVLPNKDMLISRISVHNQVSVLCYMFAASCKYIQPSQLSNSDFADSRYWIRLAEKYKSRLSFIDDLLCHVISTYYGSDSQIKIAAKIIRVMNVQEFLKSKSSTEFRELLTVSNTFQLLHREALLRCVWNVWKFQCFRRSCSGFPYNRPDEDEVLPFPYKMDLPISDLDFFTKSTSEFLESDESKNSNTFPQAIHWGEVILPTKNSLPVYDSALCILTIYILEEIMDAVSRNALIKTNIVKFDSQIKKVYEMIQNIYSIEKDLDYENDKIIVINANNLQSKFILSMCTVVLHFSNTKDIMVFPPKDSNDSPQDSSQLTNKINPEESLKRFRALENLFTSIVLKNNKHLKKIGNQAESYKEADLSTSEVAEKLQNDSQLWRSLILCFEYSTSLCAYIELGEGICKETIDSTSGILPVSIGPSSHMINAKDGEIKWWSSIPNKDLNDFSAASQDPRYPDSWVQYPLYCIPVVCNIIPILASVVVLLNLIEFKFEVVDDELNIEIYSNESFIRENFERMSDSNPEKDSDKNGNDESQKSADVKESSSIAEAPKDTFKEATSDKVSDVTGTRKQLGEYSRFINSFKFESKGYEKIKEALKPNVLLEQLRLFNRYLLSMSPYYPAVSSAQEEVGKILQFVQNLPSSPTGN